LSNVQVQMQPRRLGEAITVAILAKKGSVRRIQRAIQWDPVGRSHEDMKDLNEKSTPHDRIDGEQPNRHFAANNLKLISEG
jgi:hypothetical protein